MRTILFTNARDESKLVEWIAHHLNLGFTTIYITDHRSIVPIESTLVSPIGLPPEHPRHRVQIQRLDNDIEKMKITLCNHAIQTAKQGNYDWMLYLDADEFLFFHTAKTVEEFLSNYQDNTEVSMSWLMFGSNHLRDEPTGTILESYTKCDRRFHQNVKSFVKVSDAVQYRNAHYVHTTSPRKEIHSSGISLSPLNIKENLRPWIFTPATTIVPTDSSMKGFVAHYMFQSYSTYVKRKVELPADNFNQKRKEFSEQQIHSIFNILEFTNLCDKYNEKNKKTIQHISKS